jgi:hypothetical protein
MNAAHAGHWQLSTPHYEGLLGDKQLGIGAVDVQAPNVETGEQVADRIKANTWVAPEQTITLFRDHSVVDGNCSNDKAVLPRALGCAAAAFPIDAVGCHPGAGSNIVLRQFAADKAFRIE